MMTVQHTTASATSELAAWVGAQVLLLAVLSAVSGLSLVGCLAGIAFAVAASGLIRRALHRSRTLLGPADRVTLARGVLVGGVTALVVDRVGESAQLAVVGLAAVALALDFVDGQVARRTGTASAFGARFDMEVDAVLILVLSVNLAFTLGPWVLAIGAIRYVFVAASWGLPWLGSDLPARYARKAVAAMQGIILVLALSGTIPHASFLVGVALSALLWSFGRDSAWLWRNRNGDATNSKPTKGLSNA